MSLRRNFPLIVAVIVCAHGSARSQSFDAEPNDTCLTAQELGVVMPLHTITGSVDGAPDPTAVDFFRLTGTPGQSFRVHLRGSTSGVGTLSDPTLGLFDSSCDLVAINDDFMSLESRLDIEVPADGVFVLAASSCCDFDFDGDGSSSGTYELTVAVPPPPIGSISGRVIDVFSEAPVSGDGPPFASAQLYRCDGDVCDEFIDSVSADDLGQFTFDETTTSRILDFGTFKVSVEAQDYERHETAPFDVGPGVHFDLGALAIEPPPITFVEDVPCDDLPPRGGVCSYTTTIRNNTASVLRLSAWSIVDGFSFGPSSSRTLFEAGRAKFRVRPFKSKTIRFRFRVPRIVTEEASFCASVYVGIEPHGTFRTLGDEFLFCMSKEEAGMTLMSEKEVRAKREGLGIEAPSPKRLERAPPR